MNLYIRYFDEECVVSSAEEAFDFLSSLPGITLDEAFVKDLRQYMDSPMPYPKRYISDHCPYLMPAFLFLLQ